MPTSRSIRGVVIPHYKLSPETLQALLEEFVTRDGTDSGYIRLSLQERADQVRRQLDKGDVCIVFDETTKTANIVPRQEIVPYLKNDPADG